MTSQPAAPRRAPLPQPIRRLVVKIGTQTLTAEKGGLDRARLANLAAGIDAWRKANAEVVVVSSGAVGLGLDALRQKLPLAASGARPVREKQALAAVGQGMLMEAWRSAMEPLGLPVGQVLLTREDLERRKQHFNARNTLEQLLRWGVAPIINENDTTANEEIKYGDNDGLAAVVSIALRADLLVVLTNLDGVFAADPRRDPDASLLEEIDGVTDELLEKLGAGASTSRRGTGGVASKLAAARKAAEAGVPTVIASGRRDGILASILSGDFVGTVVRAPVERRNLSAARAYLRSETTSRGKRVHVNAGALAALRERGSSLLPVGVTRVEGRFEQGEAVEIVGPDGAVAAKGVASHNSDELAAIAGRRGAEIEETLGYAIVEEAVHRDDLLLL